MYDKTNGGLSARTLIVNQLAWWHSFKQGCYKIYCCYGNDVFAGLSQSLFPGNAFCVRPSYLTTIVSMFQYVRIAYPHFKSQLDGLINNESLNTPARNYVLNLRTLCEYFIPVVHIHTSYHLYLEHVILLLKHYIFSLCNNQITKKLHCLHISVFIWSCLKNRFQNYKNL